MFSDTANASGNNVLAKFTDSVTNPVLSKMNVQGITEYGFIKPNYDAANPKLNMAGNQIRADAKNEFSIIDSLGESHEAFVAFKKVSSMEYAVEVYTAKGEVDNGRDDGLIAAGRIKFDSNGNGTIESTAAIDGVHGLKDSLHFNWKDKGESVAAPNTVKVNWNKMQMYADNWFMNINPNGNKSGILQSTSVDEKGNLVGHYTNGEQEKLAAVPLALFQSLTEELKKETGLVFSTTSEFDNPEYMTSKQEGAGRVISTKTKIHWYKYCKPDEKYI